MKANGKHSLLPLFFIIFLSLFLFSSCERSPQKDISRALKLDVSSGSVLCFTDTHDAFLGDGLCYGALQFADTSLMEIIQQDSRWNPLPLDDTLTAVAYGLTKGQSSVGPYLTGEDGEPLFPGIEQGYYYFQDRNSEQSGGGEEADLLERRSFNFILAIYDSTNHILYFGKMDT